jgi:hypothetical protein
MPTKVAFFSVVSLALIGAVFGAYLLYQGRGGEGVEITIDVPERLAVGEPFTATVSVGNTSDNVLNKADLRFELPPGVVFAGEAPGKTLTSKALNTIGPGSLIEQDFDLVALTGSTTIRELAATLSYLPGSLTSRFERSVQKTISIEGSSLTLDLASPSQVFSGETFQIEIRYRNVSPIDMDGLTLAMHYPPGFVFSSASPKPDQGTNTWNLGGLHSGSEGKITITGSLVGSDGAFFAPEAALSLTIKGRSYVVAEQTSSIAIAASPLSLAITLNNNSGSIPHLGDSLSYKLTYRNNTDVGLADVVVRAQLLGSLFDLGTVSSSASLQSFSNTLIWNAANTQGLSLLPPGASGSVEFQVKLKSSYLIKKLSDKHFTLKVKGEIESPTVPYQVTAVKTLSAAELETKVGGAVSVDAQGFFRDAASGILNKGPWPLKVGQTTQFTVHWVVTNYSNDVRTVTLKAFLGGNVSFIGSNSATSGSSPSYNPNTQEVLWTIDALPAGKGIVGKPAEAVFQISLAPSQNQVNQAPILMKETTLTATDDFTGENFTVTDGPITTSTLTDPTVTPSQGIVLP